MLCVLLDSLYCMSGCVIVSFCNHGFTPIKQTTLNSQPPTDVQRVREKREAEKATAPAHCAVDSRHAQHFAYDAVASVLRKLRVPFNWHSFRLASCLCSSP